MIGVSRTATRAVIFPLSGRFHAVDSFVSKLIRWVARGCAYGVQKTLFVVVVSYGRFRRAIGMIRTRNNCLFQDTRSFPSPGGIAIGLATGTDLPVFDPNGIPPRFRTGCA